MAKQRNTGRFGAGNKKAVKHGAYAKAFVDEEDREQFLAMRQEIAREFRREEGPDTAMLDATAMLFIRHGRAVVAGEQDLANKTMASIFGMLDRLKATRASRDSKKAKEAGTTPAEWAANLLAGHHDEENRQATQGQDDSAAETELTEL